MPRIKMEIIVNSDVEITEPGLLKDNIWSLLNEVRPDLVIEDLNVTEDDIELDVYITAVE